MQRLSPVASRHPVRLADADRVYESRRVIAKKMEVPGGFGCVMVGLGVLEGGLGVAVIGSLFLHAWWSWTTRAEVRSLQITIAEVMPTFRNLSNLPDPNETLEDLRDEISDAITGVMSQMHVPRAADHALGMLSAFVQSRLMGGMPALAPAPDAVEQSTEHPEP